jgi:hypothetical protein
VIVFLLDKHHKLEIEFNKLLIKINKVFLNNLIIKHQLNPYKEIVNRFHNKAYKV